MNPNQPDDINEPTELEKKIMDLEGKIAALESAVQNNRYDAWLTMLGAQINALKAENDNKNTIPDVEIPVINEVGGPFVKPDGNSSHTADGAKTIEFQPGTGTHKNELQLVNADTLSVSTKGNIPYIDIDANGLGSLAWLNPDTDYKVLQRKADDTLGFDYVRAHS